MAFIVRVSSVLILGEGRGGEKDGGMEVQVHRDLHMDVDICMVWSPQGGRKKLADSHQ